MLGLPCYMLCVSLRCFGYFQRSLYLTVTCSEFATGVRDYEFFWEMASWFISVFSSCWINTGYMFTSVYGGLWFRLRKLRSLRSCSSFMVVDIPFVTQKPIPMVQRWTIVILQLQFALGGRCPWYAVVQVPVPQLQFFYVVVYTPVVAQSLSHGPDSSSDLGFPSCFTWWSTSLFTGRAGSLPRRGAEAGSMVQLFV